MAKKKDEKDVLVVRDEKTGEISVVAGLNADGTPKRTPAKAENAQSFLQFDRHGDVLDNFFKNFFRQCKEPSRFGFYRIAADQAENLLEVMKQLLKDPEANKELLAPHKVDTSDYEKKVQEEMAAQQTEKQEPQKQENMEQRKEQQQDKSEQMQGKRGYQPIDESKINWQELEDRWGVKRDNLEKSGDLTKMLNYGKSDLVKVKPTFGGESFELDARLSFKKDGEGNISLVPHFIRKEQKLDEYKEHKFSDEDRKNLRETGNLGRVVDIVDRETGEIIPSFISIDRKTNEITDIPASRVRIPERIGKTEITTQERDMLRAGLPVRDKLIDKTIWGAYFSGIGCAVLIAINVIFVPVYGYIACAWAGFAGYGTAMLLSYFVGQKKYPINYPVKEIMIYVVLALILFAGMTEANRYFSSGIACLINTVLILIFAAYLVKKDFPLKSLPVIGKYFRK